MWASGQVTTDFTFWITQMICLQRTKCTHKTYLNFQKWKIYFHNIALKLCLIEFNFWKAIYKKAILVKFSQYKLYVYITDNGFLL